MGNGTAREDGYVNNGLILIEYYREFRSPPAWAPQVDRPAGGMVLVDELVCSFQNVNKDTVDDYNFDSRQERTN